MHILIAGREGTQFAESDLTRALNLRARAMEVIIKFEATETRCVSRRNDDEKDNFRDDDFVLKWSRRCTALFNYLTANLLMHRPRANAKTTLGIILDITWLWLVHNN